MAARELDEKRLELVRAIEDVDTARVQALLEAGGIDLAASLDGNGGTYLLKAAEHGSDQILRMVLDAGADPDQPNNYGTTPMHLCAQMGISTKLAHLLRAGANVNPQDKGGETPLHKAVQYKRADYVERLLKAGVDSTLEAVDGRTADALLDSASSLQKVVRENQSPPWLNTRQPFTKQDVMAKNERQLCALDAGATWARVEVVLDTLAAEGTHFTREELLQEGKAGKSYLQRAIEAGAGREIISHLTEHGEPLQPVDLVRDGESTPLLRAAVTHKVVDALFSIRGWQGRSSQELMEVYRALSEAGQAQVPNCRSLFVQLSREEQSQQAGRGR